MTQDLSLAAKPVSNLFQSDLEKNPSSFSISNEQVHFFKTQGYLPDIKVLSDFQADKLLEELVDLSNPQSPGNELFHEYHSNESTDPNKILFHALGAWRIKPSFHDILWAPGFLIPASQLLGGAVRFWHDQLFCKPARHGGVVAWHQDYSYWTRTQPMQHLTCWIALDDANEENGCLHYIPQSHEWDLLPITGLAGDMESIKSVLKPSQYNKFTPTPVPLKKGHATFHHPLTIHGSFENRSAFPRRAVVLNVFLDGTFSSSDEPLLKGVPPVPKGQSLSGQFFPLLFDGKTIQA
ncbi:MAG: phytanoyl-CoA dioxygenase family protein [Planctomycetota bacterium]|nr:phytanoyl-CoA dioxygenase family protein [Planctomycetota bacterium]